MNASTDKQQSRHLAVGTPLGTNVLLLLRFAGREELSGLFEYELEMLSDEPEISPAEIVGRNLTFTVARDDAPPRFFNGFVNQWRRSLTTDGDVLYRATVVPWLWFLTKTADCRIFQNKTAPEIIEQIFRDLGFSDFDLSNLTGDYAPRDYCVQYRESDFDFVSRLMEEVGIYYFFAHENGRHTLMLADQAAAYFELDESLVVCDSAEQADGGGPPRIARWNHRHRFHTGRWAQTDYNFETPRRLMMTNERSADGPVNSQVFEVYDYPGRYADPAVGRRLTRIRLEAEEAGRDAVFGECTYRTFTPGGTFTIEQHTSDEAEVGRSYVVLSVEHAASVRETYRTGRANGLNETDEDKFEFRTQFRCIPVDVPFRPRPVTRRPVVEGPQTAVVVGPPGEEIYTDEHGRVKVQFPWDREGRRDEHSSCWIRVSQTHAGKAFGSIDLPRIGEEVVVAFLDGDPDRPIITGRVYNGVNRPPFNLPGGMTRSGAKSQTHKGSGYNEITLDDTPGQEQIRVNAKHDLDVNVGNSETVDVAVDRITDVGNDDALDVAVDSSAEVGNDLAAVVGNNAGYDVAGNVVIEAGTSITLQCGGSTIHMNQAGVITISGSLVSSIAKASNSILAPMTQIAGSGMLTQAGLISLMLGGVCHVRGQNTTLSAAMIDIDGNQTILKGTPLELGEVGAPLAPPIPADAVAAGDAICGDGAAVDGDAGGELAAESTTGDSSSQNDIEQTGPQVDDGRADDRGDAGAGPADAGNEQASAQLQDGSSDPARAELDGLGLHDHADYFDPDGASELSEEELAQFQKEMDEIAQRQGPDFDDRDSKFDSEASGGSPSPAGPRSDDDGLRTKADDSTLEQPRQDHNDRFDDQRINNGDDAPDANDDRLKIGVKVEGGFQTGKKGTEANVGASVTAEYELQKSETERGPFTTGNVTTAKAEVGVNAQDELGKVGVEQKVYVQNKLGDELYCKTGGDVTTQGRGNAEVGCGIQGALNQDEKIGVYAGKSTDKDYGINASRECAPTPDGGLQCERKVGISTPAGKVELSHQKNYPPEDERK